MTADPFQATQAVTDREAALQLDVKVRKVFGDLAIDKRRLPASQLQKREFPLMSVNGFWTRSYLEMARFLGSRQRKYRPGLHASFLDRVTRTCSRTA